MEQALLFLDERFKDCMNAKSLQGQLHTTKRKLGSYTQKVKCEMCVAQQEEPHAGRRKPEERGHCCAGPEKEQIFKSHLSPPLAGQSLECRHLLFHGFLFSVPFWGIWSKGKGGRMVCTV